jgi:hypothetical protein
MVSLMLALRERDLAASPAQVHQQQAACHARLAVHQTGPDDPEVDEPALFQAGDDLDIPTGLGLHPGLEGRCVAGVAHGRCGYHTNLVHPVQLHRTLKPLESAQRSCHGLGRNRPRLEDAGPQPRHLAVFSERFQLVRNYLGNLQPAGIGTDIDGGKGGHGSPRHSPEK